jgi:hemerythrin-like domain-containing protein
MKNASAAGNLRLSSKEKYRMEATALLMQEHRVIERVIAALETAARRLAQGASVPADFFLKAADFIKNFADGSHHAKEEGILFEVLTANGMPRNSGPVAVMLLEHEEGRRLTRAMREAAERLRDGDQAAAAQVAENALGYAELLRQHIQKEDKILFPMSERMIPAAQHAQVAAAFAQIAGEAEVHEKYLALAAELELAAAAIT